MRSGEQLVADIGQLLSAAKGDVFLKRLFWEILGYRPANDSVPAGIIPACVAEDVSDARIFARWGTLIVVHVRFAASLPLPKDEQPIISRIYQRCPDAIVVFSNYAGTEWDICRAAPDGKLARLALDGDLHSVHALATALAKMRTFKLQSGDDLTALETQVGTDQALVSPKRRLDRRTKRSRSESGLFRAVPLYPMLPGEEQIALGRRWRVQKDASARESLICSNLRLALHHALKQCRRARDFDDLSQEACIGLVRAADLFDPDRGYRFSTYATWWVRQRISRGRFQNGSLIQTPWYMVDAVRDSDRGKEPRHQDGAIIPPKYIEAARRALHIGENVQQVSANVVDESETRRAERHELAEHLDWAVQQLEDARLRRIIQLRFGLNDAAPLTLEEVGEKLKVTRERIRQLEVEGLAQLRQLLLTIRPLPSSRPSIVDKPKWDWNEPAKHFNIKRKYKLTGRRVRTEGMTP